MDLDICIGISRDLIRVAFPPSKTAGSFDPTVQNSSARCVASLARRSDRSRGLGQLLLGDLALEIDGLLRQLALLGLEQEGVEAAAVIDGLERIGGNAQLD